MQIAKGIVVMHAASQQTVYGVTPPEVLILHMMHFKESNGSPLKDFVVLPGEAVTVDFDGKIAEPEYFHQGTGKTIPAKPAVPAVTHKRTNREEIERLKRKYTGNIERKTAFAAAFGDAKVITLPDTFEEIVELVGISFPKAKAESLNPSEAELHRAELAALKRPELVKIALSFKLQVSPKDSVEAIVDAIITEEDARDEAAAAASTKTEPQE